MTGEEFRRLALGMPGAVEGEHMGHPDFRVDGRIFATLTAEDDVGMLKVSAETQEALVKERSGVFSPAKGAWGRAGCTMVRLEGAGRKEVREALAEAWRRVVEGRKGR
jgi:hypothetical protein